MSKCHIFIILLKSPILKSNKKLYIVVNIKTEKSLLTLTENTLSFENVLCVFFNSQTPDSVEKSTIHLHYNIQPSLKPMLITTMFSYLVENPQLLICSLYF